MPPTTPDPAQAAVRHVLRRTLTRAKTMYADIERLIALCHAEQRPVPTDVCLAKKVNLASQRMLVALCNGLGRAPVHAPAVYAAQFARAYAKCKARTQEQYARFEARVDAEHATHFEFLTQHEGRNVLERVDGGSEGVRRAAAEMQRQFDRTEEYAELADKLWGPAWRSLGEAAADGEAR